MINKKVLLTGAGLLAAALLNGCNTLQDGASGVKNTAYDAGGTVINTAAGAEKDINAAATAVTPKSTAKHQMMGNDNHEPAG